MVLNKAQDLVNAFDKALKGNYRDPLIQEEFNKVFVVKRGNNSNEVLEIQKMLNNVLKTELDLDKKYGDNTFSAVVDFQMEMDLDVTGNVDEDTLYSLSLGNFIVTCVDEKAINSLSLEEWKYYDKLVDIEEYLDNFEDDSGNTYFSFTGTEGLPAQGKTGCDFLSEDWVNNYRTGLDNMSCQFEPSKEFVEKYKGQDGNNYVTGHSQGGANAMYACASVEGCKGKVFDGTGISQLLNSKQRERLVNSGLIKWSKILKTVLH